MFKFLQKIFSSIIGFRTKKKINIVVASCYYIFFLIMSIAMGKGFLFGLVFTFTCPILVFSVVEIITKRKIRHLLDISICFLLIVVFAYTVPSQQTKLSSINKIKQTTIENKPIENQNDGIDSGNNYSKPQNQNTDNSIKNHKNMRGNEAKSKQPTTEKSDNIRNNQNKNVVIEPSDKEIDSNGFIYNVNKTYSIGMTEITVKHLIIRTSWGKYIVTMEYEINNNDSLPINWKFSGTNKGNMIGTIVTNGREKIWMGKASNYTDKYIDQHIESGTLQAKSEFNAAVNFSFDTQYEDPKLKENEMMNFTIYYSQNNIDSEFSIILDEK